MSTYWIPRDFSLREMDLIAPDGDEDATEQADRDYREYCQEARTVETDDLMVIVGEAFSTSDLLRSIIEETKRQPFAPGARRHLHVSDCIKLGEVVAALIDQALDQAVGMRQACGEGR